MRPLLQLRIISLSRVAYIAMPGDPNNAPRAIAALLEAQGHPLQVQVSV